MQAEEGTSQNKSGLEQAGPHRANRSGTHLSPESHSRGRKFRTSLLRDLLAAGVVISAVVALGYALHPEEPSQRKLLGRVVELQLYAELDRPPRSRALAPDQDSSRAAPSRPDGYRRAVMFHDPLLPCPRGARPVDCGAKLEIFRHRSAAIERTADIASESEETTVQEGALVLRVSSDLPTDRRIAYQDAFVAAVDELDGFRELARLDQAAASIGPEDSELRPRGPTSS